MNNAASLHAADAILACHIVATPTQELAQQISKTRCRPRHELEQAGVPSAFAKELLHSRLSSEDLAQLQLIQVRGGCTCCPRKSFQGQFECRIHAYLFITEMPPLCEKLQMENAEEPPRGDFPLGPRTSFQRKRNQRRSTSFIQILYKYVTSEPHFLLCAMCKNADGLVQSVVPTCGSPLP